MWAWLTGAGVCSICSCSQRRGLVPSKSAGVTIWNDSLPPWTIPPGSETIRVLMNSLLSTLPILLPVAVAWVEKQEVILLERGVPLTEAQVADARRVGVKEPDRIRRVEVEALPQPENEDVMFVAKHIGFFSSCSVSLALGYAICHVPSHRADRLQLVHELVHVSQYERMGGIKGFLSVYLRECIDPGYPFGALEQEAILIARDVCRQAKQA